VSNLFKNPITKNGDVRYFEIFKIALILSFVFGLITMFTKTTINWNSESSIFIINLFVTLLSMLLLINLYFDYEEFVIYLKTRLSRNFLQKLHYRFHISSIVLIRKIRDLFIIPATTFKFRVMRC